MPSEKPPIRRAFPPRREGSPQAAGMGGAPKPTALAVTSRLPTRRPTTAGNCSPNSKRSRPKSRRSRRGASSRETNLPISASIARSTLTGAASMAASTASRGRPTPFSAFRRGSISRPGCSPRPMPRRRSSANWPSPAIRFATIAIGTNTDPYQPIERRYRIMRRILEVLSAANHPVGIVTKSALVLRDLDLLDLDGRARPGQSGAVGDDARPQARPRHGAQGKHARQADRDACDGWSRPACRLRSWWRRSFPASPTRRWSAFSSARRQRACSQAGYVLLRLPLEIGDLFTEWLQANCPDRAKPRVVADALHARRQALRGEMGRAHGGRRALRLDDRTEIRARRASGSGSMQRSVELRTDLFTPPARPGQQLALF